jgi:hypothetical protein
VTVQRTRRDACPPRDRRDRRRRVAPFLDELARGADEALTGALADGHGEHGFTSNEATEIQIC